MPIDSSPPADGLEMARRHKALQDGLLALDCNTPDDLVQVVRLAYERYGLRRYVAALPLDLLTVLVRSGHWVDALTLADLGGGVSLQAIAAIMIEAGEIDAARTLLGPVVAEIRADPDSEVGLDLLRCLAEIDPAVAHELARRSLDEAEQADEQMYQAWLWAGHALHAAGLTSEAHKAIAMAVDLLPPEDPSITQGTPEDMYHSALYCLITETGYDGLLAEAVGIAGLRRLVDAVDGDAAALGRQGVFTLRSMLAGSFLDLGEEDDAGALLIEALAALSEDEGWVIDGSHGHAADVLARLGESDGLLLPLIRTEEDTVARGSFLLDCALPFLSRGLLDPGLDLLREAVGYLQAGDCHGDLTHSALAEAAAALVRAGSPGAVDEALAVARSIPEGRGTDHAGHESCYRAEALAAIACALLDQGHEKQAFEVAAEAHEATWKWARSRPEESQLLAAAAKALAASGSPEADEMARRAIEAGTPGGRWSGRRLEQACLHRLVGESEVARSLIEKAITDAARVEYEEDEYYPDPTVSLGSLCSPLLELGERQLAEQVARRAWQSARHPKELFRDEDWAAVVSTYVDCGFDPQAAYDAASEALGVDRDDDDHDIPDGVLARLAEGLALGGDAQRVREIARQIAKTCPFCSGYAETYARLGRAYLTLGRPETAHALLDQALMIAQRSRGHRLGQIVPVAEALLAAGRAEDASDLVALPCMPSRTLADLGKVLGKAGEKKAAIAALRRSLLEAEDPGQRTAALESVCEMMGVWSRGELILEVVNLADRHIG